MMLDGIAVGGPRAGVKLTAPPGWPGRIKGYDGHYFWDEAAHAWCWDSRVWDRYRGVYRP
ncbi:MAG TPA: hypothetical protein VFC00_02675 [Micromonosporaceae bacterium]|nr:hypothetical protein [Micromonosporaceae bacterium]